MAQKDRYCVSWEKPNGEWEEVTAKTYNEGKAYFDMVDPGEYEFKVMYDIVSGEELLIDQVVNNEHKTYRKR